MRNGKVIHEIPEYNGAGIYALVDGQTEAEGTSVNAILKKALDEFLEK